MIYQRIFISILAGLIIIISPLKAQDTRTSYSKNYSILDSIKQEHWFIKALKDYNQDLNFLQDPDKILEDYGTATFLDNLKIATKSGFTGLLDYKTKQISHLFLERRKLHNKLVFNRNEANRYINQLNIQYRDAIIQVVSKNLGEKDVAYDYTYKNNAFSNTIVKEADKIMKKNFEILKRTIESMYIESNQRLKKMKVSYYVKKKSKIYYFIEPKATSANLTGTR